MKQDELMAEAFKEAQKAYDRGECPVGAVLVRDGEIVARAGNEEVESFDPTAHAEILVLRRAGIALGRHTFPDCEVYTTLWPCPMCENALLRAKVPQVVCGARSFRFVYENTFDTGHLTKVGPIMEEECRGIFVRWVKETGREFILDDDAHPL
ncbi:MAG TPA: nucleoside deaminase [Dehalococcoidia bacterium]